jgi:carbamoyltransferase
MSPKYVLGINAYHGDVSAVLLRDGQLVAALEEERFRRIKHYAGFPSRAIQKCLEMAGITGEDVQHVAISRDPKANLLRKAGFMLTKRPSLRQIFDRAQNARKVRDLDGPLREALGLPEGAPGPRMHYVEHHPAHLASAFFVSPFDEAAVVAIDGFGDFVSTSLARGTGNTLEVLERVYFPHSLGIAYTAVTQYLGFLGYGDEYKVMGLAPYGHPTYVDQLRKLVHLKDDGTFELDLQYFRHWNEGVEMEWDEGYPTMGLVYSPALETLLGTPARKPDEEVMRFHEDVAHSMQQVFEECAFHVLRGLHRRTGLTKLCVAGGCGMNSVANGKIRANTPFQEIYVQPAAADNGTALGAAYYVWHQELGHPRTFVMTHGYWGTAYPDADVAALVATREDPEWTFTQQTFATQDETIQAAADLLASGHVVGWFQGRMEWGSRALGNRSILADPSRADMRDLINLKIKFRERFRPFAPSILEDALDEYFVDAAPDPFMQQVYPVQPDKRAGLPAITHVDGSGRIQTVNAAQNPVYYQLISAFRDRTGVPILLNTSFNENEPVVDTPEQALACFLRTRMDAVVIENTLVQRHARTQAHERAA